MAPCRVQIVLEMEVAARWWPTNRTAEDAIGIAVSILVGRIIAVVELVIVIPN